MKLLYFILSIIGVVFPYFILPIPWWVSLILLIVTFIVNCKSVVISSFIQACFWIAAIVSCFFVHHDLWVYIVGGILLVEWIVSFVLILRYIAPEEIAEYYYFKGMKEHEKDSKNSNNCN